MTSPSIHLLGDFGGLEVLIEKQDSGAERAGLTGILGQQ